MPSSQDGLPGRIPGAPLPRPAERLDDYVRRVAASASVQRHRAMELLGLPPGTSATARLDDHPVRALAAATGMTAGQARALTAPPTAADRIPDLENLARRLLQDKQLRPGGARARPVRTRPASPGSSPRRTDHGSSPADLPVHELSPAPYRPAIVDLD